MYEKILFMDVDLLPLKNLDDVFVNYEAPAGIISTPTKNYFPGKSTISPKEIEKILKDKHHTFTAGFILLKPKKGAFGKFVEMLNNLNSKNTKIKKDPNNILPNKNCKFFKKNDKKFLMSGEDEHSITLFYRKETWSVMPIIYYYECWKTTKEVMGIYTSKDVAVYNYMTPIKPWEYPYDEETYDDIKLYHGVMKEIEKKYPGLNLNFPPPKEAKEAELLKNELYKKYKS
jgi:alpha-N-acetylglucosamine transferase